MISVTPTIAINENEIQEEFIRSTGPGGQNVNKVATAVQLRFDVRNSSSLPEDVRVRLIRRAGKRISDDGVLIIKAKRFRSQDRNRQDALDRLIALIRKAAETPKKRYRTRPSVASVRNRLEEKRRQAKVKKRRRPVSADEDF